MLKQEVKQEKAKPLLRLNSRNSFIANAKVRITGIELGYSFGKRIDLGMGYNTNRWAKFVPRSAEKRRPISIDYVSAFFNYQFFELGKFSASYPMQFGFGAATELDPESANEKRFIVPYEAVLMLSYKPIKYCGLGLGIGYRVLLLGNQSFGLNFNSPIYSLKFNLFFDQIWAEIKQQ